MPKTLPGPDVARIDVLIALSRFYVWWCMAVLSWWSGLSGRKDLSDTTMPYYIIQFSILWHNITQCNTIAYTLLYHTKYVYSTNSTNYTLLHYTTCNLVVYAEGLSGVQGARVTIISISISIRITIIIVFFFKFLLFFLFLLCSSSFVQTQDKQQNRLTDRQVSLLSLLVIVIMIITMIVISINVVSITIIIVIIIINVMIITMINTTIITIITIIGTNNHINIIIITISIINIV